MIYRTYKAVNPRPIPIEFFFNDNSKVISLKRGQVEVNLDIVEKDRFERFLVAVNAQLRKRKKK